MLITSWNVNGLAARMRGDSMAHFLGDNKPDVLCLQEIKMLNGTAIDHAVFSSYPYQHWNFCCFVPAYSGTAILSRREPYNVIDGIDDPSDEEARCIVANFDNFYLVNVYMPNAEYHPSRADARAAWDERFSEYITSLSAEKPLILCGDMNTTLSDDDVRKTLPRTLSQQFASDTRFNMLTLMREARLVDAFRYVHPDTSEAYTWWSYRRQKQRDNIGWRLDYFLISEELLPGVINCGMFPETHGSDHCPIFLSINI